MWSSGNSSYGSRYGRAVAFNIRPPGARPGKSLPKPTERPIGSRACNLSSWSPSCAQLFCPAWVVGFVT
jgi:hypothetical protein